MMRLIPDDPASPLAPGTRRVVLKLTRQGVESHYCDDGDGDGHRPATSPGAMPLFGSLDAAVHHFDHPGRAILVQDWVFPGGGHYYRVQSFRRYLAPRCRPGLSGWLMHPVMTAEEAKAILHAADRAFLSNTPGPRKHPRVIAFERAEAARETERPDLPLPAPALEGGAL